VAVFIRASANDVRHFYTGHASLADDISERGIDLLAPECHVLDLTPKGTVSGTRPSTTAPRLRS
jgi:hypothetical protein